MKVAARQWLVVGAVVVVVAAAWLLARGAFTDSGGGHTAARLSTVQLSSLPVEARQTVGLIDAGGPFPYDRDGVVFQNWEGLLPSESTGYYHEYTVPTPGASDRGARRIITGSEGEMYWTSDHYQSFERIVR